MTSEQLTKIVEDAARALGEHFEAVQILVSNSDSEGTSGVARGTGNFYARLAMAQEFIDKDSNEMLASQMKKEDDDEE